MSQTVSESSSDTDAVSADVDEGAEKGAEIESVSVEEETETEEQLPGTLPLDQVFGILKNQRRRHVLKYLKEADGEVTLSEVAEQISAWENDKDVSQISSSERKRVYVGLYQCHLPKMDAMDIVSFNKPRGIIELGKNTDEIYKYIDMSDEPDEPPWHVYSAALSVSGAVVLGGSLLLRPLTTAPVVDVAVVFLIGAFLAYALANLAWVRRNGTDDETAGSS